MASQATQLNSLLRTVHKLNQEKQELIKQESWNRQHTSSLSHFQSQSSQEPEYFEMKSRYESEQFFALEAQLNRYYKETRD